MRAQTGREGAERVPDRLLRCSGCPDKLPPGERGDPPPSQKAEHLQVGPDSEQHVLVEHQQRQKLQELSRAEWVRSSLSLWLSSPETTRPPPIRGKSDASSRHSRAAVQ